MIRAITLLLCLTLCACTQFPELDGTVAPDLKDADFPRLVPLEPLLIASAPVVADPVQTSQALDGRVAALRARAAALQQRDVVDAETERKLESARN